MKKVYLSFGQKPKNYLPKIESRRLQLRSFANVAYKSDGKDDDDEGDDVIVKSIKDLGQKHKTAIEEVKGLITTETTKAKDEIKADFETRITEAKSEAQKATTAVDELKGDIAIIKSLGDSKPKEEKTFNEILAETVKANIEAIKNHKKGQVLTFRMKGFEDETVKEVKTVGDMSATNFTGIGNFTTDRRTQIIETPYNRVWLSDILPTGSSSNSSSVLYPKENGGEGAAALWTDYTADKAQMDFDLTTQSAFFKWIAGIVIIDRETLDDVDFMISYLQQKMLVSLKTAENNFILNGSTDTNPVSGLLDLATAYDGAYTVAVERIIDAAWGQIVENTKNFYNPTDVILTPREAVGIGLNKASGSGEYDLPPGSVGFVNGRLTIGGLQTVTTTEVGTGNFLAFDRNATMFIRRMMPEIRMFEDAALAKKNKVMFRIEERATLIGFNNDAIVSGTLAAAP